MQVLAGNRILQHTAFWCFYVLIYTFNFARDGKYLQELVITFSLLPVYLLFVYTHLYLLIPRFLLRKKFLAFFVCSLLMCKLATDLAWVIYVYHTYEMRTGTPHPGPDWSNLWTFQLPEVRSIFSFLMICGLAVSVKLLKKWFLEHERKQEAERQKVRIELGMLKAQVHPHFLFNTLNNLYSLTLIKSDKAPVAVAHLSDLLRYMLYECNEKEVLLESEIEVLRKYIELERLRYGNRIDISFSVSGDGKANLIAPLLLFPFVENSFKHGISEQMEQCWMSLHLHTENHRLRFNLSNSVNGDKIRPALGGIGLQNIKKRLELIYPGKYNLIIVEESDVYIVKLEMQLTPASGAASQTDKPVTYKMRTAI